MCHSIHVKARGQSAEVHSPYHCVDTSAISLAPHTDGSHTGSCSSDLQGVCEAHTLSSKLMGVTEVNNLSARRAE